MCLYFIRVVSSEQGGSIFNSVIFFFEFVSNQQNKMLNKLMMVRNWICFSLYFPQQIQNEQYFYPVYFFLRFSTQYNFKLILSYIIAFYLMIIRIYFIHIHYVNIPLDAKSNVNPNCCLVFFFFVQLYILSVICIYFAQYWIGVAWCDYVGTFTYYIYWMQWDEYHFIHENEALKPKLTKKSQMKCLNRKPQHW